MILSAILNLGNIEFDAMLDDDHCSIGIESQTPLCNAAVLLNVDIKELGDALTSYTRLIRNQKFE